MEPRLRDALIDSSVAPELDPSLVRALGLPEDFLEEVRRRGVPLRAPIVDDERLAYHPLVRELLAARLVRERPAARRSQLHAVVAEALEAEDRGPEAVEHWLAAGGTTARARWSPATARRCWRPHRPRSGAGSSSCPTTLGPRPGCGCSRDGSRPRRGASRTPRRRCATRWTATRASGDDERAWVARAALADSYLVRQRFERGGPPGRRLRIQLGRRRADGRADGGRRPRRRRLLSRGLGAVRGCRGAVRRRSARAAELRASTGSSWTCRAGGSTPRSPACARRWRSSSASIRSASCRRCWAWPRRSTTSAASRTRRSRASCAPNAWPSGPCSTAYVSHFGHVFSASLHARDGRLVEAELALSRTTRSMAWMVRERRRRHARDDRRGPRRLRRPRASDRVRGAACPGLRACMPPRC